MTIERWRGPADVERDVGGAVSAMGLEATEQSVAIPMQLVNADLEAKPEGGRVPSGGLEAAAQASEAGNELVIGLAQRDPTICKAGDAPERDILVA